MTPEGKIKAGVKKMLAKFGDEVYSHWPVQNGMGSPTLDCIGCAWGYYFAIETKAPGKSPTTRQLYTMGCIQAGGGVVFVVDSDAEIDRAYHALLALKWASQCKL